jgi:hypothetical protein
MNNEEIRKEMGIRPSKCCQTCENSRESGYFRDMVECKKLPSYEGRDVHPWDICERDYIAREGILEEDGQEWRKEVLRCPRCGEKAVESKEGTPGYDIFRCSECDWELLDR